MKKLIGSLLLSIHLLFAIDYFSISLLQDGLGISNISQKISVSSSLLNPGNTYSGNRVLLGFSPGYSGFDVKEMYLSASAKYKWFSPNIHIISQTHSLISTQSLIIAHPFIQRKGLSAGLGLDYTSSVIKHFPNMWQLTLNSGLRIETTERLSLGISYLHIFSTGNSHLKMPEYIVGINYKIHPRLILYGSLSKAENLSISMNYAFQSIVYKNIRYSVKYNTITGSIAFSLKFESDTFIISESLQWHPDLELLQLFSLAYSF